MSLKTQINDDVKQAMRSGEKELLKTLRMITAAVKQREIDERTELDDTQVLAVVEKMIKQRRESAEQYRAGDRPELAEAEEAEIALLEPYLPEQLSDEELAKAVDEAIEEAGAKDMSSMGQVMGLLKPRLQGRADMSKVSGLVRSKLAG
ncbi:GatB/YqeY domain-containing protein [Wenzhouxiangella sp. EGI_FJ10305]|uniref:GatB/YqeY domain-containing protein n=1 Tax=Wenzhouxiangella sp. EGI_FJ10305 TaxID=3243768 RepID=UPI0035D842FC